MLGRLAPGKAFLRGVLTLASATGLGQLIMVAALPLLSRIYGPEDFGTVAVFLALVSVVLVVSSLRYEMAIPLARGRADAGRFLGVSLALNAIVALSLYLAILLGGERAYSWTNTPALADITWLFPLALLAAGTYKALSYWSIRHQDFRAVATSRITQSVATVAAQVAAGLVAPGPAGLAGGRVIGQASGAVRLARGIPARELWQWTRHSPVRTLALLKRHRRFPKLDAPAAFVDTLGNQLPHVALAMVFGPASAGLYFLAERVLATPLGLVSQAVAQVLFGNIRQAVVDGSLHLQARRMILTLGSLVAAPALAIMVVGEEAFRLLFGSQWSEAGVYASYLMVGLSVQFVFTPLSMVLLATEGQGVNLVIHLLLLTLKVAAVALGHAMESADAAILGFSVSTALVYAAALFVILRRAERYASAARNHKGAL